ncbi:hypothetical protein [Symbiopectobacterium sp. RP]|uniref:hypothetical protein n=1 Tax=Symbiopectobacterium sp. RP TaxID=3248553 RepID=UPI003D26FF23
MLYKMHANIANRLKNDYSQCHDMWQKIQLIVIKIMSLSYISPFTDGRPLSTRLCPLIT